MHLKQTVLTASLLTPMALVAAGVSAEDKHEHDNEHRQHDTHVHGIAALNLALEGKEVHIGFESPAANIVGFEHAPSSEADHAALDKAVATLKAGDKLFEFNSDAECRMEMADVTSELLEDDHEEHEKHEDEHSDDHDRKKDEHDHEEHEPEGEVHSEFEASYHFECKEPGKLTRLTVELFEAFPGTEKLEVQYVIESKQGATELTAADHVVKF